MNAIAPLIVRPDIGGILHIIFTPGNPLQSTLSPAPMLDNSDGKPVRIDLDRARVEHPGCSVISYNPKDQTSTVLPLIHGHGWYEPTLFQTRLIHAAITRAMNP